ncbi:GNAT family N-acetyltransferase [Streptomyces sp. NPDC090025]|uniref:GNAT family N-acetyltransferase n=1 Tax=Streptomyces sp. NPDC090025 TaxID=3365922 RepID=UPI003836779C
MQSENTRTGAGAGAGADTGTALEWSLRPARPEDVTAVAELKAVVMRDDLTRLGRYDEVRVRQRLRDEFRPEHTWLIELAGGFAGSVAFGPHPPAAGHHLEHFYLAREAQGRGLGTAVLRGLLDRADAERVPVRLTVLRGSAARRLYERMGFTVESEDPIDIRMVRAVPEVREPGR